MISPRPAVSGWKDGWYVVPHEVTWRDLDGIGHVNNAVYFSYFEWARTKYWLALHEVSDDPGPSHLDFIVARAECDFRRQLSLSEIIEIGVRIGEMRRSSFDFVYEIRMWDGGEIAATGKVVMVLFSWKSNTKRLITEELRERIAKFQPNQGG